MTADRLLRLYPRAWRERYGEEFVATIGAGALHVQQVIDIVAGAIDAWLSSDVRRTTRGQPVAQGGSEMIDTFKAACAVRQLRFTKRDALIGAGVMIGASFGLSALGIVISRNGFDVIGEAITSLAFPVSLTLSMPFTYLKGQPWRAQVVVFGVVLLMLTGATYVATKL